MIVSLVGIYGLMSGNGVTDPEATSKLTAYFKSRLDMPLDPKGEIEAVEEDMGVLRQDLDVSEGGNAR